MVLSQTLQGKLFKTVLRPSSSERGRFIRLQ
jgi:hypothetical protein